jgi:hypothetical protein
MPGEYKNDSDIPSFITTHVLPAVRPSFQPSFSDIFSPTSPGNTYGTRAPTTSELGASLSPPPMDLLSTTIQLPDNNPDQNLHAFLNCNMTECNERASNCYSFSQVLTIQPGSGYRRRKQMNVGAKMWISKTLMVMK